jgi:steroid delta-isomerase-like uncharacterized protein
MAIERNKGVVRRYYEEVVNGGALDALDELAVPDYEEHDPFPGQGAGREGLRARVTMLRTSFRQHLTIAEMVAEGDRVVVRWTSSGTHEGEFMGIPATGSSFAIAGIDIHAMRDGKMAEHWHVVDLLSLLQQLGVSTEPANPGRSPIPPDEAAAHSPRS